MFVQKMAKSQNPKTYFIERFENPYYALCHDKNAGIEEKKEMYEMEKSKQVENTRLPSSGFFTSKVNRNASLFESKKHTKGLQAV